MYDVDENITNNNDDDISDNYDPIARGQLRVSTNTKQHKYEDKNRQKIKSINVISIQSWVVNNNNNSNIGPIRV
jgi:hypothetical protein